MPHYIVESIEFDFSDSMGTITEQEQEFITDNALGLWHVEEEDDLVDTSQTKRVGVLVQLNTVRTAHTR